LPVGDERRWRCGRSGFSLTVTMSDQLSVEDCQAKA
jgi:hypothetical protein